jgi:hypothetical protein
MLYGLQSCEALQEIRKVLSELEEMVTYYFSMIFLKKHVQNLHNEELHNFYSSPSIIRMIKSRSMRWTRHVAQMGERRNAYRILVGKPERRRPLGRPRCRWADNIKMDLR